MINRVGRGKATLIISDFQGRNVMNEAFEGEIKEQNISHLIAGLYIVTLIEERSTVNIKLVIE
ncbi:MAG: T9SS type A sorting domain-containing protein [Lentimicrobium sp.]|nr:T9SS type A sorting domain-containing protein [Lentimicrobium sp.]